MTPAPIVVADTGPIHYLVLIQQPEIIPALFNKIFIPAEVRDELARPQAPEVVRNWIKAPPEWLEIATNRIGSFDFALEQLDAGERAALALAASLSAGLLLMDDRAGVRAARNQGFRINGYASNTTIGRDTRPA